MMENLELNNTYMKIENTKDFFPKFKFTTDNIPIGDSVTLCISLHWAFEEKGRNFDLTKPVLGFNTCEEAVTGKFIWNEDDPTLGVDIPVWTQFEKDIDCTDDEDCQATCDKYNALFLNGRRGKKCYHYKILQSICLSISYDSNLDEFNYSGGCFQDGIHYTMTEPEKNKIYYFDNIKVEVRNSKDPVIKAGKLSNYSYSFGAPMVSFDLFIFYIFISFILIRMELQYSLIYYSFYL